MAAGSHGAQGNQQDEPGQMGRHEGESLRMVRRGAIPPGYRSATGSDRLGDEDPDIEALVDHADTLSPVARVEHEPPDPIRAAPGVMVKV